MPLILLLQGPHRQKLEAWLRQEPIPMDRLIKLLIEDGAIEKTLRLAQHHAEAAGDALRSIDTAGSLHQLVVLPAAYMKWALTNLVTEQYRPDLSQLLAKASA